MGFKPTPEQDDVVDAAKSGTRMKIKAGAGSGKTSTLKLVANTMPKTKFLFVAFGRAIKEEAERSFPKNVTCLTSHGMAYRAIGAWRFQKRLKMPRQRGWEQAKILGIREPLWIKKDLAPLAPQQTARIVMETIKKFCYSADTEITEWNVPRQPGLESNADHAELAKAIIPFAQRAWADILDDRGLLRYDHDYYLKQLTLSGQQLDNYDVILLDEAQDSNRCLSDYLDKQKANVIPVGDSAQAIFCQPVGTMVDVPSQPTFIENNLPNNCTGPECRRRRDHKASGLCDAHEKQVRAGKQLTSLGAVPHKVAVQQKPIEDLKVGDMVVTYDNSHVHRRGRPISSITRFPYDGRLIRVATEAGLSSAYTPKHHCIVRIGRELEGTHVVYLMRRGDQYRIGRVPMFYKSAHGQFGPGIRAGQECADGLWILSVHATVSEAALAEALAQHQFNIPGMRFEPTSAGDVLDVRAFWDKVGSNRDQAEKCLEHFGRLIDFPLWTSGRTNLVGVRRPIVTAAANLIDGFTVLPAGNEIKYNGKREYSAPASRWEPVKVTEEWYQGDIISLEVADHHTYYADGILTHNSWRGATDAIRRFNGEQFMLSKSFRFGPAIAAEANQWLSTMEGEDLRITGYDEIPSVITHLGITEADAVICRTNAGTIRKAIEAFDAGLKPAVVGGTEQIDNLAKAAIDLKAGRPTSHPELYPFTTWGMVEDYCEHDHGGSDLLAFVRLVNSIGPEAILDVTKNVIDERYADLKILTGHKAKGLEYDNVLVSDDFKEPAGNDKDAEPKLSIEDARLAYVVSTRAKRKLDRGSLNFAHKFGEGGRLKPQFRNMTRSERESITVKGALAVVRDDTVECGFPMCIGHTKAEIAAGKVCVTETDLAMAELDGETIAEVAKVAEAIVLEEESHAAADAAKSVVRPGATRHLLATSTPKTARPTLVAVAPTPRSTCSCDPAAAARYTDMIGQPAGPDVDHCRRCGGGVPKGVAID